MRIKNTDEQVKELIHALSKMHFQPFRDQSNDPLRNAQRNLDGKTHYYDDDTVRWHGCRVLQSGTAAEGLLFWAITSDALDMHNTKRGFRYVVHNVFGNCVSRPDLEEAVNSQKKAKALLDEWECDVLACYETDLRHRVHTLETELDEAKMALDCLLAC